jgi:asparagine synthetase B (glutamine-hydrolysing)
MSGICLAAGASDPGESVGAMLACMARYGQEKGFLVPGSGVALGAARHARLPGDKPLRAGLEGVTVALDGEIFDDSGPLDDPAAVIADHYRANTLDRVAWLNGSFAAIVVDPAKNRIVLATDRLGSRTLFVWRQGRQMTVASRLDALLGDSRVSKRLSVQGLTELLSYQRTVSDHTQYADIRAMPAAQIWSAEGEIWREQETRRLVWHEPDFDQAEGAARLADGILRAVKRRTADHARHGLLLSGGLDARWVLAGTRAAGHRISCVTLASHDNLEVDIARRSAQLARMPFRFMENLPSSLSAYFDAATVASDGLFTAPINLFGKLPDIARTHDVLLSGHGLDYTLRGYYLPCTMVRIAGSTTRLPKLRAISNGNPRTVSDSLRVGIHAGALQTVLTPRARTGWDERRVGAMALALSSADIEDPYNAWDAFVLHCLGRHYAYSDFVAMNSVIAHRAITFDPDVLDLYFSMKPAWRASGRMAQAAMKSLAPDLMALPDANSGFSANHGFATQTILLFARATARRSGLVARPPRLADVTWTHGSWSNLHELLRRDSLFVERLKGLAENAALLDSGLFDRPGLRKIVEQHLSGRSSHRKLLLELLTISSWLTRHSYSEVIYDG